MAKCSKVLPLTASCLSITTALVQISAGAYEKVASDLGLGGGFCKVEFFNINGLKSCVCI